MLAGSSSSKSSWVRNGFAACMTGSAGNDRTWKRVPSKAIVRIVVSQGSKPLFVPDLIGQNLGDALGRLGRLGLGAHVVEQPDNTRLPGRIISQFPAGNSQVKKGTIVTLAVAIQPTAAGR